MEKTVFLGGKSVTIPAHREFDEGKKGPWLKLTWEDVRFLHRIVMYHVDPPQSLLDEIELAMQAAPREDE